MGDRGPVPKRSAERRRRNKDATPTDTVTITGPVKTPPCPRGLHTRARAWYKSLSLSGQSAFYEPSDWQMALYAAELMSRLLEQGGRPSAQLVAALNSLLSSLLVTEGDRRRVRLEIERPDEEQGPATVTMMDEYRASLGG